MRTYSWFLEPLNAYTNQVFSRELPEENFFRGLRDRDGTSHNLWRSPGALVTRFRRSRRDLGIDFLVYCREGNGALRPFVLPRHPRSNTKQPRAL